jgi:nitroreductase
MEVLRAIDTRASAGRLTEPGVTPEHLARIIDAAQRAPDHGRLRPWRFQVLDADLKETFAQAAAAAKHRRLPALTAEQVEAERAKIRRSPTIIVAGCAVRLDYPKVPEIEQVIAVGAAVQNLFLAARDLGYGVMWKTGAAAYDPDVKAVVGLQPHDHIVGIMHLGTPLEK